MTPDTFTFNDFVTLPTRVFAGLGSFNPETYQVQLPLGDQVHDISPSQHTCRQFRQTFGNPDIAVRRIEHEGRIVYLYDATLHVEAHVAVRRADDTQGLCPLIERVMMVHQGPQIEVTPYLYPGDIDRLLARMEFLIDAAKKAEMLRRPVHQDAQ